MGNLGDTILISAYAPFFALASSVAGYDPMLQAFPQNRHSQILLKAFEAEGAIRRWREGKNQGHTAIHRLHREREAKDERPRRSADFADYMDWKRPRTERPRLSADYADWERLKTEGPGNPQISQITQIEEEKIKTYTTRFLVGACP